MGDGPGRDRDPPPPRGDREWLGRGRGRRRRRAGEQSARGLRRGEPARGARRGAGGRSRRRRAGLRGGGTPARLLRAHRAPRGRRRLVRARQRVGRAHPAGRGLADRHRPHAPRRPRARARQRRRRRRADPSRQPGAGTGDRTLGAPAVRDGGQRADGIRPRCAPQLGWRVDTDLRCDWRPGRANARRAVARPSDATAALGRHRREPRAVVAAWHRRGRRCPRPPLRAAGGGRPRAGGGPRPAPRRRARGRAGASRRRAGAGRRGRVDRQIAAAARHTSSHWRCTRRRPSRGWGRRSARCGVRAARRGSASRTRR